MDSDLNLVSGNYLNIFFTRPWLHIIQKSRLFSVLRVLAVSSDFVIHLKYLKQPISFSESETQAASNIRMTNDGFVVSCILTSPRFHSNSMSIKLWQPVIINVTDDLTSDVKFSFVGENV